MLRMRPVREIRMVPPQPPVNEAEDSSEPLKAEA